MVWPFGNRPQILVALALILLQIQIERICQQPLQLPCRFLMDQALGEQQMFIEEFWLRFESFEESIYIELESVLIPGLVISHFTIFLLTSMLKFQSGIRFLNFVRSKIK